MHLRDLLGNICFVFKHIITVFNIVFLLLMYVHNTFLCAG
jgi:hypothetical protein